MHSRIGLEEYVRVRLEKRTGGEVVAHPVLGKPAMLSTMVKADGPVVIALPFEGLSRDSVVEVICW